MGELSCCTRMSTLSFSHWPGVGAAGSRMGALSCCARMSTLSFSHWPGVGDAGSRMAALSRCSPLSFLLLPLSLFTFPVRSAGCRCMLEALSCCTRMSTLSFLLCSAHAFSPEFSPLDRSPQPARAGAGPRRGERGALLPRAAKKQKRKNNENKTKTKTKQKRAGARRRRGERGALLPRAAFLLRSAACLPRARAWVRSGEKQKRKTKYTNFSTTIDRSPSARARAWVERK